jgi:hypothetical protein
VGHSLRILAPMKEIAGISISGRRIIKIAGNAHLDRRTVFGASVGDLRIDRVFMRHQSLMSEGSLLP